MLTIRKLSADEVTFAISCEPEDIPVEGHASAIDEKTDKSTEDWIYQELEQGNLWAWCTVKVEATWKGFSGTAYLGCCSYESEEAFKQAGGYFEQMKDDALEDLNDQLAVVQELVERESHANSN